MNLSVTIFIIIIIYYHGRSVSLGAEIFFWGQDLAQKLSRKKYVCNIPHTLLSTGFKSGDCSKPCIKFDQNRPSFIGDTTKKTFGLIFSGHSVYAMAISDLQSGRWRTTTAHCTTRRRWRWTIGTDRWLLATPSSSRTRSHCPRRSPAAPTDRLCDTGCRSGEQVAATGRSGDATGCGRRLVPTSPWRRPAPAAARRLRRRQSVHSTIQL